MEKPSTSAPVPSKNLKSGVCKRCSVPGCLLSWITPLFLPFKVAISKRYEAFEDLSKNGLDSSLWVSKVLIDSRPWLSSTKHNFNFYKPIQPDQWQGNPTQKQEFCSFPLWLWQMVHISPELLQGLLAALGSQHLSVNFRHIFPVNKYRYLLNWFPLNQKHKF